MSIVSRILSLSISVYSVSSVVNNSGMSRRILYWPPNQGNLII
jgi:hypothetical protein